jgi:hypothetical protein
MEKVNEAITTNCVFKQVNQDEKKEKIILVKKKNQKISKKKKEKKKKIKNEYQINNLIND